MSLCLFELIVKWIGILFVLISSNFGYKVEKQELRIENNIENIAVRPEVTVTNYTTKKIYNKKLPFGTVNVLTEGMESLVFKTDDGEILLHDSQTEVLEIGSGPQANYVGSITGYGADCVGCSGIVSCRTSQNRSYDLRLKQSYDDEEYGEVRILAADLSLFKCGTVIEVTPTNGKTFTGVVMDTGIAMRNAWRNSGKILMDVAFQSEYDDGVYAITDKTGNVSFNVKRWGW